MGGEGVGPDPALTKGQALGTDAAPRSPLDS